MHASALCVQKQTQYGVRVYCMCVCVHVCMHTRVCMCECEWVTRVVNKQAKCVLTCSGLSSLLNVPRIISPSLPPLLGLAKINKGLQWQLLGGDDMDLITSLYVWVCGWLSVGEQSHGFIKGGSRESRKASPF